MSLVCSRCIEEPWLADYIERNATDNFCDYCEREADEPIALYLDDILPHIQERIGCLYEDAAEHVPWDSGEGGYQLSTMSTWDVLENVGLTVANDQLQRDLIDSFDTVDWVERNAFSLSPEDALRMSWETFSDLVKHRVRYLLFPPKDKPVSPIDDDEGVSPEKMLDGLGELFLDHGLIQLLRRGIRLYRVRIHDPGAAPPNTMGELGPPPISSARFSNRMSPAGMSMFYGALDEATALAETTVRRDGRPAEATIAVFELVEDLTALDLTALPQVPSVFASDEANLERPAIAFLWDFVHALTRPVEKDGREHVDYVPSQVVTEYVRYRMKDREGHAVRGILYPSAQREARLFPAANVGTGCVLFVAHEDINAAIVPDKSPFRLLPELTKTIAVA